MGLPDLSSVGSAVVTLAGKSLALESLFSSEGSALTLSSDDLFRISEVVLLFLKDHGYEGIVAFPDPRQIDPLTGKDLREPTATRLDLKIWVSRVKSIDLQYATFGDPRGRRFRQIERLLDKWSEKRDVRGNPLRDTGTMFR